MNADEHLENAKALAKQTSEYQGHLPPDAPADLEISEFARAELMDESEHQFSQLVVSTVTSDMNADELLENAKALAKQTSEYQGHLPPDAPADLEISEFARAELMDECEHQFSQLVKLQNEIALAETDSVQDPAYQTESRVDALAAELKELLELQPKLLSSNPEVLLAVGKEELSKLNKQLEMVLSCSQAKRDKLKDVLKSEQDWLIQKEEVLRAATERVTALQEESDQLSEKGVLQAMKKKIQRVKGYHDDLLETLSDLLEEHFPLPQQEGNAKKKSRDELPAPSEDLISVHRMLELLMNKAMESPHDPYVEVNGTFWPPYTEMLLRYGVASRHPVDCLKIRLEAIY